MHDLDPLNVLSNALNSCIYKDAADISYQTTDWLAYKGAKMKDKNAPMNDY